MRRIAVMNQKGGVGKTTTAVNVGAALAHAGHRVLLIDLDPQAHLTLHLGLDPSADLPGTYSILTDSMPLANARHAVRENLHVVPSHIDLAAVEVELISVVGREMILRDALAADDQPLDYVLMDCPPSLGVLTLNALAAADEVLIPLQPHVLALQGMGKLLETVSLVSKRINPNLTVTGVVLCMNEHGTRLASEVIEDLRGFLDDSRNTNCPWSGARVFRAVVRRNIKLAECPGYGQSIFEYAPKSRGAWDYTAVALELADPDAEISLEPTDEDSNETEADADLQSGGATDDTHPEAPRPEPDEDPVVVTATRDEKPNGQYGDPTPSNPDTVRTDAACTLTPDFGALAAMAPVGPPAVEPAPKRTRVFDEILTLPECLRPWGDWSYEVLASKPAEESFVDLFSEVAAAARQAGEVADALEITTSLETRSAIGESAEHAQSWASHADRNGRNGRSPSPAMPLAG